MIDALLYMNIGLKITPDKENLIPSLLFAGEPVRIDFRIDQLNFSLEDDMPLPKFALRTEPLWP